MDSLHTTFMTASQEVLGVEKGGIKAFVQQKLHDRCLHETVVQLNNDVLFGTAIESEAARKALARLGFAEV